MSATKELSDAEIDRVLEHEIGFDKDTQFQPVTREELHRIVRAMIPATPASIEVKIVE
jgi:hypothetical protein